MANYGSGSVAAFPLDPDGVPTGRVDLTVHSGQGPDPDRQDGRARRTGRRRPATACSRSTSAWTGLPVPARPGTGRLGAGGRRRSHGGRHRAAPPGPSGRTVGSTWSGSSATVTSYTTLAGTGDADWHVESERVPAQRGGAAQTCRSEIAVGPDGRRLYVANRGPDTSRCSTWPTRSRPRRRGAGRWRLAPPFVARRRLSCTWPTSARTRSRCCGSTRSPGCRVRYRRHVLATPSPPTACWPVGGAGRTADWWSERRVLRRRGRPSEVRVQQVDHPVVRRRAPG